jgi:hypothetical protein
VLRVAYTVLVPNGSLNPRLGPILAANTVTLSFYWGRKFTDVALLTGKRYRTSEEVLEDRC